MLSKKLGRTLLLLGASFFSIVPMLRGQSAMPTDAKVFKKYDTVQIDRTAGRVLTITKVKAPSYAVRPLIVKGFRDSIPVYQKAAGLDFKAYSLANGGKFFGGVYLWRAEQDAKNWFDAAWFESVQKKYNTTGAVDYYKVVQVESFGELLQTDAAFTSVSSPSKNAIKISGKANGLIKAVEITAADNQKGWLTLWDSADNANKYFQKSTAVNTFFDSPVLLDNRAK